MLAVLIGSRCTGHDTADRLVTNVPRDLEAICEKALHADPVRRYASAQAFADDLNRWLQGEPTVARPARAPRRVLMWARRNKGWAAAWLRLAMTAVTIGISHGGESQHAAANAARREAEAAKRGQLTLRAQTLVTAPRNNRLVGRGVGVVPSSSRHRAG